MNASLILLCVVRVLIPLVLAVGAFLGAPNDPQLSGFFWLLAAFYGLSEASRSLRSASAAKKGDEGVMDNLIFASKQTADDFLFNLRDLLDTQGKVSVHDLYSLASIAREGSREYGWKDFASARVRSVGEDGWVLYLKPAQLLKESA